MSNVIQKRLTYAKENKTESWLTAWLGNKKEKVKIKVCLNNNGQSKTQKFNQYKIK